MTLVYVGTYTRNGASEGIYVLDLDLSSGALRHVSTMAGVANPTYVTLAPDGRTLYATNELIEDASVSALSVAPSDGKLMLLNRVASQGADPAHLSIDPSGGWLLVANYTGGTVAVLPIQPGGALGEATHVIHHQGTGPHPTRQQGPHPHMIVSDPAGRFVLVPDLGADAVVGYRLDTQAGQLIEQPQAGGRLAAGAGPRHLAFGTDGRYVYVVNELASTVAACSYDSGTGRVESFQTVSTLPEGYDGSRNTCAAIFMAPSGRFLYASNRGHDSVARFGVDQASGRLTPLGQIPTEGQTPRDINVDPSGRFLLAANQNSGTIVTLRVDPDRGELEPTGQVTQIPSPARVLFA